MISDILEKNTFNINNIEHVFYSNSKIINEYLLVKST